MSKADKMFEELGYKINPSYGNTIKFTKEFKVSDYITIVNIIFYLKDKEVTVNCLGDYGWGDYEEDLTQKEHLAIHEKMKELGWLDD